MPLSLSFVAFNAPHFADFVIEAPTFSASARAMDGPQMYHYSKRLSLAAENQLYAVG